MTGMTPDLPGLLTLSQDPADRLVIAAAAELLERIGATTITAVHGPARWTAWATWGPTDARVETGDHPGPTSALDALARQAVAGGRCDCNRIIATDDGPVVGDGDTGSAGSCRWRRFASVWMSGCDAPVKIPGWTPMDPTARPPAGVETWSSNRLADQLDAAGAPAELVALAAAGYWHTYRSPHALPEAELIGALTLAGLRELTGRVIAGEFLADPAERLDGQPVLAKAGAVMAGSRHDDEPSDELPYTGYPA